MSIELVGHVATVVTIIMFLCPAPLAYTVFKEKQIAQNFNLLPYVTTGMTAILWLRYGLLINDGPMRNVNLVGTILETIYSVIFFTVMDRAQRGRKNSSIVVGSVSFVVSVLLLVRFMDRDVAQNALGMVASGVNIVTFASPLATIKTVLRNQNCSSFPPVPLQLAMFFTPCLWFTYAQLIHDSFLAVPNGLGILLGGLQLGMRLKYPATEYKPVQGMKLEA